MAQKLDPGEPVRAYPKQPRGKPWFKYSFKTEIEIRFSSNLAKFITFFL
jgi:hypothetical protein